jgi:hypothetical protein
MFWYDLKLWKNFKMKHKILQNLCTFKNSYFSIFDYKKNWHIEAIINTICKKFQKVSFENSFLGKHVFWEKDPKKDNSPKCKVNTLVRYMVFGPFNLKIILNYKRIYIIYTIKCNHKFK